MKVIFDIRIVALGIFLFSFIGSAKSNQNSDLTYIVKYLGEEHPNCLDISAAFKGNPEGEILIKVPSYTGPMALKATKGNVLYTKKDNNTFLISLEPNSDLDINYQSCIKNQYRDNELPIIEHDFFHFIAERVFVFPSTPLEEKKITKFQFINFPINYSILTNHFLNKRDYTIEDSLINITRSVMAGGKFDVKTITIKNHPVHIVLKGKWSMFKPKELIGYVQKIIVMQRKFTSDYDFPHFAVIIFDSNVSEGEGGVSGSLYGNVLSMVITDAQPKYKHLVLGALSHELFHAWMGNKIKLVLPQGNMQWFFEGVNDFYGWQFALESGQVSKLEYINYYNKILKEYELSPHKEASNEEISKIFKLRNFAGRLAMIRGHIVFMEILNKLNSQSRSRAYLDAALLEIFDKYSGNEKYLSEAELDNIFRKHLGDDNWDHAANIIKSGKGLSLSFSHFPGDVFLKNIEMDIPDFGFDLATLEKEKRIRTLRKESSAFLAGLREDSKVVEYGLDVSNPKNVGFILIEDSKEQKWIKFMPNTIKRTIPQYG